LIARAETLYDKFVNIASGRRPIVNFNLPQNGDGKAWRECRQSSVISVNGDFESEIIEEKSKLEKENKIKSRVCAIQ
jgi:hypothetical protein